MMKIAERNRAIKRTLTDHYGSKKVRVRGSSGTAYGWVSVYIDADITFEGEKYVRPGVYSLEFVNARRQEENKVWDLLDKAGLSGEIGTYGYDSPGSDYGYGRTIHIEFVEGFENFYS